jgi:rhamnosyltransferase
MRATVLVRAKNEAADIGRTLELVRRQTIDCELIVVDSGSTDGTPDIAREHGAAIIPIAPHEFTYGRALNLGTDAARAPVVVPLSAHAFPPDTGWLERLVAVLDDPRVACACGSTVGPDGDPLTGRFVQDWETARRNPFWGYTNSAGGFRKELHARRPFREDMPFTEDKEWAWYWLQRGHVCVVGPDLAVDHDHTKDPVRETWTRARREWIGYGMYLELEPYPLRSALRDWRSQARGFRHPLNILREGVRVAGEWSARRSDRGTRDRSVRRPRGSS